MISDIWFNIWCSKKSFNRQSMMLSDGLRPPFTSVYQEPYTQMLPVTSYMQRVPTDSSISYLKDESLILNMIGNFSNGSFLNKHKTVASRRKVLDFKEKNHKRIKKESSVKAGKPLENLMLNESGKLWSEENISFRNKNDVKYYKEFQNSDENIYLKPYLLPFSYDNHTVLLTQNSSAHLEFSTPVQPFTEPTTNDRKEHKHVVEDLPFYIRIWASIAVAVVLVVGVVGNALVPILVCLNKDLRHSTNLFLLNLAAADLLVLLVCLPTALVELHVRPETWVLGHAMCWLVPLVEVLVTRASVLTLVVISVERYLAICRPLRTQSSCSKPRAAVVCAALWLLALVSAIPTLQATQFMQTEYYDGSVVEVCITGLHHTWVRTYYLASAGVFVAAPFLLLLGVYTMIACRLLLQKPRASPHYLAMQQWKAKKQVSLMLGAVVVVFFLCLLPFQVLYVWIILSSEEAMRGVSVETYYNVLYVCRLLLYINSAANPVIYNVMSSKFRNALLRLLGRGQLDGSKRSLRRQSTVTTSFSSSSFVSLRRRASQVFSRTLSRKPDVVSSDAAAREGPDGRTEGQTGGEGVFAANLSEDDLQNQNYNPIASVKNMSVQENNTDRGPVGNAKCIINNECKERCRSCSDDRTLGGDSFLDAECPDNCVIFLKSSVQPKISTDFDCDNSCSSSDNDLTEMLPLNIDLPDEKLIWCYSPLINRRYSLQHDPHTVQSLAEPQFPSVFLNSEAGNNGNECELNWGNFPSVFVNSETGSNGNNRELVNSETGNNRELNRKNFPSGFVTSEAGNNLNWGNFLPRGSRVSSTTSDDELLVVPILEVEGSSQNLHPRVNTVKPPTGKRKSPTNVGCSPSTVPENVPASPKKPFVKKVSFQEDVQSSARLSSGL